MPDQELPSQNASLKQILLAALLGIAAGLPSVPILAGFMYFTGGGGLLVLVILPILLGVWYIFKKITGPTFATIFVFAWSAVAFICFAVVYGF